MGIGFQRDFKALEMYIYGVKYPISLQLTKAVYQGVPRGTKVYPSPLEIIQLFLAYNPPLGSPNHHLASTLPLPSKVGRKSRGDPGLWAEGQGRNE